jgi:hypothetical protein
MRQQHCAALALQVEDFFRQAGCGDHAIRLCFILAAMY